jgi:hypothetical protein
MKTIFLKELRENLKWGLLSLGFFMLSVAGWIHEASSNLMFVITRPETTGLPFAVIGLAMGVLQTWFETRPDNFAFVVHRPVSRLEIFIAKSAAGLLLIYASLAIPAAVLIGWAATPGHLATPFQGRSTLPLLADISNVAPFYFAGMVLAMRKARWFGSRLLPLGLAVGCSIAVRVVPEFWQAMLIVVATASVSAMAAWNVFSTAGVDDEGRVSKFALGTMIYAGALGIGCVIISMQSILQNVTHWHDLRVDREGNVLAVSWTIQNKERSCVVCDANGKPLPEYEGIDPDEKTDDSPDRFLRFSVGLVDMDRIDAGWATIADIYGYRTPTPGIVGLRTVAKPGTRLRRTCLFNVPQRIIEMYDPVTEVLLGAVGPAGYTPGDTPPTERFPRAPLGPMSQGQTHTLAFPKTVYWMELDQRRVRKIFDAPVDDPVVAATELLPQSDPPVVVVTQKRFHVMKPTGEIAYSVEHGLDLSRYWFTLAVIPSNNHLLLRAFPISEDPTDVRVQNFLEFDTEGKLVRRTEPAPFPDDRPETVRRRTAVAGFFYPLAGLPLFAPWVFDYFFEMDATHNWWLFHGFVFGTAALSAMVTFWLSRRCGFGWRKTIGWTIGNLLLGPAGVVVMLSLNDWPAREVCAACGGKRLVGRQDCTRCGAGLAPPQVDGREIFEPADAFSTAA